MRIDIVTPIVSTLESKLDDFQPFARPDTEVHHTFIDRGPESIESLYDESMAVPHAVIKVVEAAKSGADAIIIDCMGDPGLSAGREATGKLVLGPTQVAMHVAAMLAQKFSVLSVSAAADPMFEDFAGMYGLSSKLSSVRSIDIPVLEIQEGPRLDEALLEASILAIEEDGAHAIVFGCTTMNVAAESLRQGLAERGYPGIPVIDPGVTTLKIAEALVDLNLTPSRRTYPEPRPKTMVGYELSTSNIAG